MVGAAGPAAAPAPVADLDGRPATEKQPIIVIDNYDSFTYNLCQVFWRSMLLYGACSLPNCLIICDLCVRCPLLVEMCGGCLRAACGWVHTAHVP